MDLDHEDGESSAQKHLLGVTSDIVRDAAEDEEQVEQFEDPEDAIANIDQDLSAADKDEDDEEEQLPVPTKKGKGSKRKGSSKKKKKGGAKKAG